PPIPRNECTSLPRLRQGQTLLNGLFAPSRLRSFETSTWAQRSRFTTPMTRTCSRFKRLSRFASLMLQKRGRTRSVSGTGYFIANESAATLNGRHAGGEPFSQARHSNSGGRPRADCPGGRGFA